MTWENVEETTNVILQAAGCIGCCRRAEFSQGNNLKLEMREVFVKMVPENVTNKQTQQQLDIIRFFNQFGCF